MEAYKAYHILVYIRYISPNIMSLRALVRKQHGIWWTTDGAVRLLQSSSGYHQVFYTYEIYNLSTLYTDFYIIQSKHTFQWILDTTGFSHTVLALCSASVCTSAMPAR